MVLMGWIGCRQSVVIMQVRCGGVLRGGAGCRPGASARGLRACVTVAARAAPCAMAEIAMDRGAAGRWCLQPALNVTQLPVNFLHTLSDIIRHR